MEKFESDEDVMREAIALAKKGLGYTSPNPVVGCVILDGNRNLIGSGYHKKCGGPHAEIEALNSVSDKSLLEGAHVFVTLEPCAHEGRTGSCAKALAQLPIKSVTYGIEDPNPLVAGKGVEILKEAGIEVFHFHQLEQELEELAEIFLYNQRKKKAFVALKVATTLDGAMALDNGESKWITNEESRKKGHWLRGVYDAIVVGVGTFLSDDPSLDVRHPDFPNKSNRVVIVDPDLKSLESISTSKIFRCHKASDIFVICKNKPAGESSGVQFIEIPYGDGFDPNEIANTLYKDYGICSLYVEGGAQTYSAFLKGKSFQRLYQFLAPTILGAKNSRIWSEGFGVENMCQNLKLKNVRYEVLDDNILITGVL